MIDISRNWYAVITAEVLYDRRLSPIQKLLVAVISNSSNEQGYCWASNAHFADILDCNQRTIQRHLEILEDRGFISRIVKKDPDTNQVVERVLLVNERPYSAVTPPDKIDTTPPVRNVVGNNKIYNNKIKEGVTTNFNAMFGSPKLDQAWSEWVAYRKQKKQTMTEITATRQIKKLMAMPEQEAIACIERSIENGWTGLFPEKKKPEWKPELRGDDIVAALKAGKGLF